jgi:integrase
MHAVSCFVYKCLFSLVAEEGLDRTLPELSGLRRDEIFVAVNGRRKRAETISGLFKETTLAHLGFKVTPHQMRHSCRMSHAEAPSGAKPGCPSSGTHSKL